jgi:hypothetical protein
MATVVPLLSLLATTAFAPATPPPVRLDGELVVLLREEAGLDVALALAEWRRELESSGPLPETSAPEAVAPAVRYDRGLSRPLGEMVLAVPLLSF